MLRRLIPLPLVVIALGVFIAFALSSSSPVKATDQFPTKRPIQDASPQAAARFGAQIRVGDIDHDRIKDIVVTAPGANIGTANAAGKVIVLLGPCYLQTVTFTVDGLEANANLGASLAVGDANNDGIDDVIVGAPNADANGTTDAGKVFVFAGVQRTSIPPVTPPGIRLTSRSTPDIVLTDPSPQAGGHFGSSVAVGNIGTYVQNPGTADTQNDVIVGAPDRAEPTAGAGAVYVFWSGSQSHVSKLISPQGVSTNVQFGYSLAVGRFDGSHIANDYRDLLVGAPNANELIYTANGDVDLYKGTNGFSDRSGYPDALIYASSPVSGAQFGYSLAMGNLNGDGFEDVVVGAPREFVQLHYWVGAAYVVEGRSWTGNQPIAINDYEHRIAYPGAAANARVFGMSVGVGNVDGDARDDIEVDSRNDTAGGVGSAGLVYIWKGTQLPDALTCRYDCPLSGPDITLQDPSPQVNGAFGFGGVVITNLDQEAGADVLVASPFRTQGSSTNSGNVTLLGTEADSDADQLNDSCDNCPNVANGPNTNWPWDSIHQMNSDSALITVTGWNNADLTTGHAVTYTDYTNPIAGMVSHPWGQDFQYADDNQGNACQNAGDQDLDRDGLTNDQETSGSACINALSTPQPSDPRAMNSNPSVNLDTDGWECQATKYVTNPEATAVASVMVDTDGDGIPDVVEVQKYGTLPDNSDTDGDGISDGVEVFDVTGDGTVWKDDAWSVCAAIHGNVPYNVDLDLNKDGVINLLDMQWMNSRLGSNAITCPP